MPITTWMRDWNDLIRDVFYPDEELKSLMMLPENTTIIDFINNYFIRASYTNTTLTNQDVRIVYSDLPGEQTDAPNVKRNELSFDIFVKLDHLHNASNDRLEYRTQLIANRIIWLLTKQGRYHGGYRFWIKGDWDLGTRTVGYARYNVTFNYMKVY